ncbi:hypothetical protein C9J45_04280 [Photobacterium sp. GB-1]|nr:hypothetical protein C9J45_04280 [Photobacterium sp. GB-1]
MIYFQYIIYKEKPDLVYTSFLSSYGILTSFLKFKCKSILSVWGTDVNGKVQNNIILQVLAKKALKSFYKINSPAEHIRNKLILLGAEPEKIDIFQYGIEFEKYQKKDKFDIDGTVKIISIRNWDDLYNIENVILAFDLFTKENKFDCELILVGKGNQYKTSKIKKLLEKIDNDRIILKGFLPQKQLSYELNTSNIVISIPSMDGTPLSLLEALYVGLCPILSNIDANLEWVDKQHGFYVDPKQIASIKRAIEKSVSSMIDEENDNLLIANRHIVEAKASYKQNTNRLENLFIEAIYGGQKSL